MLSIKITRTSRLNDVVARIKKATDGPTQVKVGFPKGKAEQDIVSRAVWNEFGVRDDGTKIPERPFFRNAMRDGRDTFENILFSDGRKILRGDMKLGKSLDRLGIAGVGAIQRSIGANTPPPNAPQTIALKGSSKTLIDTGEMRQRTTFEVVKKK